MEYNKIYVAGHNGLVGSAVVRALKSYGVREIVTRSRGELDLTEQAAVRDFFKAERPDAVVLAAAKVGGIHANAVYPADFIWNNCIIQCNAIDAAYKTGVKKFVFLGSSCIYPKLSPQPICEDSLLSGPLELTNQWYAVAKIAGIKLCQAYRRQYGFNAISLMPTNLYGPGDNFDRENSHVLPALLRRFHEAKVAGHQEVVVWGSGQAMREFMHVDDCASAIIRCLNQYDGENIINVGTGEDVSIAELSKIISDVTGYSGSIIYDTSKPDGTPRKLLDVSKLKTVLGWSPSIPLAEGVRETYQWFLAHYNELRL